MFGPFYIFVFLYCYYYLEEHRAILTRFSFKWNEKPYLNLSYERKTMTCIIFHGYRYIDALLFLREIALLTGDMFYMDFQFSGYRLNHLSLIGRERSLYWAHRRYRKYWKSKYWCCWKCNQFSWLIIWKVAVDFQASPSSSYSSSINLL